MELRAIKTAEDYTHALAYLEELLDSAPSPGSADFDRLEVLSILIEDYEESEFPRHIPDALTAIRFRMDQQDLLQKDLVPFIGSASKVSEVLGGKRRLSLSMVKSLHEGLGIPADILLQDRANESLDDREWERFPLTEMVKRGWISGNLNTVRNNARELLSDFFAPLGGDPFETCASFRTGKTSRTEREPDTYALAAWSAYIANRASDLKLPSYTPGSIEMDDMRQLAKLSWSESGPQLAVEYLAKFGVAVVVEPHLSKTYLDGAALLLRSGRPVIGLSLRYDRLDYFWFTLLHEVVHVARHLGADRIGIFDDLDSGPHGDPKEIEADITAAEALIPEEEWLASPASRLRTKEAAHHLAQKLHVHPAIVAGRIRRETSYDVLSELVGNGEVKRHFDIP